ncbi:MAG: cell division protein ZapB [bacterium]
MERLRNLEAKISSAIEKAKSLKEENRQLTERINSYEKTLRQKNDELSRLTAEKDSIKHQVEELLSELESLEI